MQFNKRKLSEVCAAAVIAGGLVTHIAPAIAATAAGTLIKNLATVTYQDANGNEYSAQSNEAVITVKQVYAAEISEDTVKSAAAGQLVYIQHTLTNNGNGEDTYTLTAENDDSIETTGTDSNNIKIFLDSNGNGLADAGEQEISSVTLEAGKSAELVIQVVVPETANPGDDLGIILTAAGSAGVVTDGTTASPITPDGLDGTNQTLITISNNAVLNYTKSAVLDAENNQITYTLTVNNTGDIAATDVKIYDALPVDNDGNPLTLLSVSAAGLQGANSDQLMGQNTTFTNFTGSAVSLDESGIGIDLDENGTMEILAGISAVDSSIASGQTISLTFVVEYDPATFDNNTIAGSAGDIIKNTGFLSADLDGPGANGPVTIPSNPTQTTLPQNYDVANDDTDANAGAGVNDGGDDSAGTNDDTQFVDQAPAGATVRFNVILTNKGTGPDTLELSIDKGDFPTGTTFTYWNAGGTTQLTDTNAQSGVDSGLLNAGESKTIMVKAVLPTSATNAVDDADSDGYTATLTATSANDPRAIPVSDTSFLKLGSITNASVDLTDNADGLLAGNQDEAAAPYNALNNDPDVGDPGTRLTISATVGSTVNVPFYIDNESGSSDSFQLSIGSSYTPPATMGDAGTLGALPTGWSVQFFAADNAGNPTGSPLTSTPLLPAGATDIPFVAVVTLSSDPAWSVANYQGPGAFDANTDGDGDQPLFIQIESANSGANDVMLDAIDVADLAQISLTPPGSNQIQPGGSVDYAHTLDNTGNTTETVELDSTNDTPNWSNTVTVTTNNGPKTLDQLTPGTDVIIGTDPNGVAVNVSFTDIDDDGNPEITLPPGVDILLTPTVFAPAGAPPGSNDTLTVTATNTNDGPSAVVEDVSSVILGQVRLTKTVAYDQGCDGSLQSGFAVAQSMEIPPGDCAVWEIVAENQGDAPARNVVITDSVPPFTQFEGGLMYSPDGTAGNLSAADPTVAAHNSANGEVTFNVGNLSDNDAGTGPDGVPGGTMLPGQLVTVRFSTKIE